MRPGMAITESRTGLAVHGIEATGSVHWNPSTSQLYTDALTRGEGRLAEGGPLAVDTGKHTGRSPKDKFVVKEPGSEDRIWWGDVNAGFSEEHFEALREKERTRFFESERLHARDTDDPESFKVRRGKVGGYRDYFSPEILAEMDALVATRLDANAGYGRR